MSRAGLALLSIVGVLAGSVQAGGPRETTAAGEAIVWETTTPVLYFVDRGGLGTLSNPAANQLVAEAFATWENVGEAKISFDLAGQLLIDITGANYESASYPPVTSGLSPIIYDDDGSVLEAELGQGAGDDVLGITSYDLISNGRLEEVSVILNGRCFDGEATTASPCEVTYDELRGVIVHELGHFAGLDHSDLNREFVNDGRCSNDAYLACVTAADCGGADCTYRTTNNAVLPTMFPIVSEDDSSLSTLHLDDRLALARLYPKPPFPTAGGTVQGRVFKSDGAIPLNGANVILRNLADPYVLSASAVSGDVRPPGAGTRDGYFRIEGVPVGNYSLEVRAVTPLFSGATSVGQFGRCDNDPTVSCLQNADCSGGGGGCDRLIPPQFAAPSEYLSVSDSADPTVDLAGDIRILKLGAGVALVSGVLGENVDVVVNDLSLLTDDLSGAGNDTCATATVLAGTSAVLGDTIELGDVDYYRIAVPAGWRLRVDVDAMDEGLGSTLDPIVQLRDACGAVIGNTTPIADPATGLSGSDPALDYISDADRSVTVAVTSVEDTAFDGADTGSGPYYLRLEARAPLVGQLPRIVSGGGLAISATRRLFGGIPAGVGASASGTGLVALPLLLPGPFTDLDGDGLSDPSDPCPGSGDGDGDSVCDDLDNCVALANPNQQDGDSDGAGDRCDSPSVVATLPKSGSFKVPLSTVITVGFSEPMTEASLTVPSAVRLENSGVPVASLLSINDDDSKVTLDPDLELATSTLYTIIVEGSVDDQDGDPLSLAFVAGFVTGSATTEEIETGQIGVEYEGHEEVGTEASGRFGASVAAGADVNGDGIRDVVVGAPRANADAGRVKVFFGDHEAVSKTSVAKLVFNGAQAGDRAGAAVSFVPDLNGDGFDEILIGAPATPTSNPGKAYLVYGQADMAQLAGPIDLATLTGGSCNPCGVELQGEAAEDLAGRAVSSAGDFDNDGTPDFMIGAPAADPAPDRTEAGIVYIVYGGPGLSGVQSLGDVGTGIAGLRILGERTGDGAGSALSDWRDKTFDGFDDLLIGAPFSDVGSETDCNILSNAGISYAIHGKASGYGNGTLDLRDTLLDPTNFPSTVFLGSETNARAGFAVWGRGDVTGDGEKDVLIGAPGMTFLAKIEAGIAFVVPSLKDDDPIKGKKSKPIDLSPTGGGGQSGNCAPFVRQLGGTNDNIVLDNDALLVGGEEQGDLAGFSIATSGDLNGDGIDEILVGAPGHDTDPGLAFAGPVTNAGQVYVIFGQPSRPVVPGTIVNLGTTGKSLAGLIIEGEVANGRLGEAVTGTSDIDDSGTADLVLGAPGDETAPPNNGSAFITEPIVAGETRQLLLSGSPAHTLEWNPTPGASAYAVYRGNLGDLAANGGVTTDGNCILSPPTSLVEDADTDGRPDFLDTTLPASGEGFWYQVAGTSSFGHGPLGVASSGNLRVDDSVTGCPP